MCDTDLTSLCMPANHNVPADHTNLTSELWNELLADINEIKKLLLDSDQMRQQRELATDIEIQKLKTGQHDIDIEIEKLDTSQLALNVEIQKLKADVSEIQDFLFFRPSKKHRHIFSKEKWERSDGKTFYVNCLIL